MKYICKNLLADDVKDCEWEGQVYLKILTPKVRNEHSTELDISGKGSQMYTRIGEYEYGWYICIPEWGVGSPLASLTDVFWNQEQLSRWLSPADAITIVEALKIYAKQCGDMA